MEHNNQKQHQRDDSNKKESTSSGGNEDTSVSLSKPKDILHDDVCSICLDDVSIKDVKTYQICYECGKVMHAKCKIQLRDTKNINYECPMCRATFVPNGSKEEIERLQRWSQRNKSWAQFALGGLYARGLGVNKDPKRASELYKLAADQGNHLAQCNLGSLYTRGEGVVQSDTLAFKYWKLSADQGHADLQFNIGVCYEKGTGVEQSDTEAVKYYKLAANQPGQGQCQSQFNLGKRYSNGRGVIQSDTEACIYYKLAAEAGHSNAQAEVGIRYAEGKGVTQSYTEAHEWWTKAAEQGNEYAIECLKILDEEGEGIKTTSSSSNFTDNSTVLCSKCNKPAQTNRTLRSCKCKGAQYCNNACYESHWKEHKPEHNRLVTLLPSTGETKEAATEDKDKTKKQKPNDRCACGSKKKYKKCCGSKKR